MHICIALKWNILATERWRHICLLRKCFIQWCFIAWKCQSHTETYNHLDICKGCIKSPWTVVRFSHIIYCLKWLSVPLQITSQVVKASKSSFSDILYDDWIWIMDRNLFAAHPQWHSNIIWWKCVPLHKKFCQQSQNISLLCSHAIWHHWIK